MLSDLPRDVAEEVLLKLPVTSLRAVRSTCKKLNTLSKNQSFTKKHIAKSKAEAATAKDFQMIMMIQHRVSLFSINLDNPTIDLIGKLISLQDNVEDLVDICRIFHCDGLLLCLTKDRDNLVVWNPFTNQTMWIKPTSSFHMFDKYALGYEKKTTKKKKNTSSSSSSSLYIHKVLRFIHDYELRFDVGQIHISKFEIYNLISKSWKVVVDVRPDWTIQYFHQGVSLKGNTYWYAQEKFPEDGPREISDLRDFLLCFDFTTERFRPRLPLPFHAFFMDTVTLSSVREEQLAVLFQKCGMPLQTVRIWISSKVEQDSVLWNKKVFLEVDMKPLTDFQFLYRGGSFFVDEERNVAVVLDKNRSRAYKATRCIAYIIGENGYFKKVDLGECTERIYYPLVCSYVPSSVQI